MAPSAAAHSAPTLESLGLARDRPLVIVDVDEVLDRVLPMLGDLTSVGPAAFTRRTGTFGELPAAAATPLVLVVTELLHNGSPFFVDHYAVDPVRAVRLVRAAGGVPVFAHPAASHRGRTVDESVIVRLAESGGRSVERKVTLPVVAAGNMIGVKPLFSGRSLGEGETATFDTKSNQVTMQGGVVLTQGQNILRGDRLVVDMTTGVSRVESDTGRVQGLFQSSGQGGPPGIPGMPAAAPAPAPASPTKPPNAK